MDDKERHQQILSKMHEIFVTKNNDYGNSFSVQFQEFGMLSSLIRMNDKMLRLKSLTRKGQEGQLVKSESIRDTLIDLANYAIMTAMELDKLLEERDEEETRKRIKKDFNL